MVAQYKDYDVAGDDDDDDDDADANDADGNGKSASRLQICKLRLLFLNRILQLQTTTAAASTATEQSLTYTNMAQCWMDMGDIVRCQGQLNKALLVSNDNDNSDNVNVEALLLQADVHFRSGQLEEAKNDIERAIAVLRILLQQQNQPRLQTERIALAYCKLATIHEMKGEFPQAMSVLQTTISDHPNAEENLAVTARLYGHLGTLQEKMGLYAPAVESLSAAVTAYQSLYGLDHAKTQEMQFLLEMAQQSSLPAE